MGIFWPRAIEFMVSMAEMPVSIMALGQSQEKGLMGMLLMSRQASGNTLGELSMTLPDTLKDRPSIFFDTPIFRMWCGLQGAASAARSPMMPRRVVPCDEASPTRQRR